MRKFIIATALVSLTAIPAFAGNLSAASLSVTANANNTVISRPSTRCRCPRNRPRRPANSPALRNRPVRSVMDTPPMQTEEGDPSGPLPCVWRSIQFLRPA